MGEPDMALCQLNKRFIGRNHQSKIQGGPQRPKHHSGKRKCKSSWESDIAHVQVQNAELRKNLAVVTKQFLEAEAVAASKEKYVVADAVAVVEEHLRKQLADAVKKLESSEAVTASKNEEIRKITLRIDAIASINQQLQLDLEWAVMLRSARAEPPTILRKRVSQHA